MPKLRPPYRPGHVYHLFNRGRSRLTIFHDHADYTRVLDKLKHYTQTLSLTLLAYCLLPNHYHFLVRQDGDARAGLLPQRVFNSYSKSYNHRYQHSGTIFQGNHEVRLVNNTGYLFHLCRYIHANPVKDGIAMDAALWPYSNYLEWIEQRPGTLVDLDFVRRRFATPAGYAAYVQAYIDSL